MVATKIQGAMVRGGRPQHKILPPSSIKVKKKEHNY